MHLTLLQPHRLSSPQGDGNNSRRDCPTWGAAPAAPCFISCIRFGFEKPPTPSRKFCILQLETLPTYFTDPPVRNLHVNPHLEHAFPYSQCASLLLSHLLLLVGFKLLGPILWELEVKLFFFHSARSFANAEHIREWAEVSWHWAGWISHHAHFSLYFMFLFITKKVFFVPEGGGDCL